MKNKRTLLLGCAALAAAITGIYSGETTYAATADQKTAVQEAAMAYYNRSTNIQYANTRRNSWLAPEESTSQDAHFLDCSGFTHALYYNTFGIIIPEVTIKINSYGHFFHDKNDDIVFFSEGDDLTAKLSDSPSFVSELLKTIEIGDVLSYYKTDNGHATLIYDIEYDSAGNPTDAVIIHSTSNWKKNTSKLTKGLSWFETVNSVTGVAEGTVQRTTLSKIIGSAAKNSNYLTVLRPTVNASNYNEATCNTDSTSPTGYSCTVKTSNYTETAASISRRKFSGAYLEATVDKHDNGYVKKGELLNYNLTIKNKSTKDWSAATITANITNGVFTSNNSTSYSIQSVTIKAGETKTYTITAKATGDNGAKISFKSSFDNISFGEVENTIGKALDAAEKSQIKSLYDELKGSYSGTTLIDKIYEKLGYSDLGLADLILGAQYNDNQTTSGSQNVNKNCNKYFKETDANALINTYAGTSQDRIKLNTNNKFAPMAVDGYYAALNTARSSSTTCAISSIAMKSYGTADNIEGDGREVYIKSGTLQNGDVLLYTNREDDITKEDSFLNDQYTVYAFIYADGTFYGVNRLSDGSALNAFNGNESYTDPYNMFSLYGRDYFAVLRPALTLKADEVESDPTPTPTPKPKPTQPETTETPQDVQNPSTSDDVFIAISSALALTGFVGASLKLFKRR